MTLGFENYAVPNLISLGMLGCFRADLIGQRDPIRTVLIRPGISGEGRRSVHFSNTSTAAREVKLYHPPR